MCLLPVSYTLCSFFVSLSSLYSLTSIGAAHLICKSGDTAAGSNDAGCQGVSTDVASAALQLTSSPSPMVYSTPYACCWYKKISVTGAPTSLDDFELDEDSLTSGFLREQDDVVYGGACTKGVEGERLWMTFTTLINTATGEMKANTPLQYMSFFAEKEISLEGYTISPRRVLTIVMVNFSGLPFFQNLDNMAAAFNTARTTSQVEPEQIRFAVFGRSVSASFNDGREVNNIKTIPSNGGDQNIHISTHMATCTYVDSGNEIPCTGDATTTMAANALRADSFLKGFRVDVSSSFELSDKEMESYMNAADVIGLSIALGKSSF